MQQLELRNGSMVYNNWIVTPLPMYLEFNLFNWTNADEAHVAGVVPRFVEMGPYVFEERHERVAIEWHPENGTVSYNQTRTWHFRGDMTNGSLDDVVTNLNVISAVSTVLKRVINVNTKLIQLSSSPLRMQRVTWAPC